MHVTSPARAGRVSASSKFFHLDGDKWFLKGLTYGPFAPGTEDPHLPGARQMRADFRQMRSLGANCIRVYHRPPMWALDLALEEGLRIFVDVPWEKHRCFLEDWSAQTQAREEVRRTARELGRHPALFALSVVNELPSDIVRFYGQDRVARFIDELIDTAKQEAPDCLTTFANYPSTEFLRPTGSDFVCFNVYLEDDKALAGYLDRLQHLAGPKPLILGEFGADSFRHTEPAQAEALRAHVAKVFRHGLAGSFVFSFTDDWYTGGHQVEDWAFGITRCDRTEKPSASALRDAWADAPRVAQHEHDQPKVSVVVCSYNGAPTLRECLQSLIDLDYPSFEVILLDDGSTDRTPEIAAAFPGVRYIRQQNMGLSVARNVGAAAATGEIVAYTDSDCIADRDWLYYLVDAMRRQGVEAIGGPNVPPPTDSWTAQCVAASPGGPSHVMLDDRLAEHVPGCNMAFLRETLLGLGGFDPQFRQAGDDVDICWRLLDSGARIGFAPAALVWHHRRNTVRAFFKQQQGYGRSEAMLLRKHHHRFNRLGCSQWNGIIYGEGAVGLLTVPPAVFHGRQGSGLFQTIYHRGQYSAFAYFTLLEWHALAIVVLLLALVVPALALVSAGMWVLTFCALNRSVTLSHVPTGGPWWSRPLVYMLHLLQPIVRACSRYRTRFTTRRRPRIADETIRASWSKRVGLFTRDLYWTSNASRGREQLLKACEQLAVKQGWSGIFHEEWQTWDMLLFADRWHSLIIHTATEHLGSQRGFTRARCQSRTTGFTRVLVAVVMIFGVVAASMPVLQMPARGIALATSVLAVALLAGLEFSRRRSFASAAQLLRRAGQEAGLEPFEVSLAKAAWTATHPESALAHDVPATSRPQPRRTTRDTAQPV